MARTIIAAVTITNGLPDVGDTLQSMLRRTGPDVWVGSEGDDAFVIVSTGVPITIQSVDYTLVTGQASSAAVFARARQAIGPNRTWNARSAYANPTSRALLEPVVARFRRVSNGVIQGFVPSTVVAGEDRLTSSVDETENPGDFEVIPL